MEISTSDMIKAFRLLAKAGIIINATPIIEHHRKEKNMDKQTLTALIKSIFKWEQIAFGYGFDDGVNNCELCRIFYIRVSYGFFCNECPMNKDGNGCVSNSYAYWSKIKPMRLGKWCKAKTLTEIKAAKNVWKELLSLLPEAIVDE